MHWEYTLQTHPICFVDRSLSQVRGEHQPMHAGLAQAWLEQVQPIKIHLYTYCENCWEDTPPFLVNYLAFVSKV